MSNIYTMPDRRKADQAPIRVSYNKPLEQVVSLSTRWGMEWGLFGSDMADQDSSERGS